MQAPPPGSPIRVPMSAAPAPPSLPGVGLSAAAPLPSSASSSSSSSDPAAALAHIEDLCNKLFNGSAPQVMHHAQTQLTQLASSVQNIPKLQFVLEHSRNPYAINTASEALTKLITTNWNHFSTPQRIAMRDYMLTFLGNKGPGLSQGAPFVVTSVVKLLCRITRLGWFDDAKHQGLAEECKKFLQATVPHCIIGLQILEELTVQMNQRQATETVSQLRKHAVSFRDASLLNIFETALTMLQQLLAGQVRNADERELASMKKRALGLAIRCLSFDFIGMQPDPSVEDNETIQIPSTWRKLVTNAQIMQLMAKLYLESKPAQAALAMELLMMWSSCRRSLFVKDEDRRAFLSELLDAVLMVLKSQAGLRHEENYHAFCRMLGRIKNNFQLTELLAAKQWAEFSLEITQFTVSSFQQWQWSKNSTHYLLHLWNRLVSVSPFVRDPDNKIVPLIKDYVPRVFSTYVQGRLQSVEDCVVDAGLENPLDDESQLQQQLQQIPNLTRYQYAASGSILTSLIEPLCQQYGQMAQTLMQAGPNGGAAVPENARAIVEGKLTWLVYLVGAQIGGHMTMASAGREGHELTDAQMARGVFQLMGMVNQLLEGSRGTIRCDRRLEIALLYFFTEFRRCYVGEHHGMPSAKEMKKIKAEAERKRLMEMEAVRLGVPVGGLKKSGSDIDMSGGGGGGANAAVANKRVFPGLTPQQQFALGNMVSRHNAGTGAAGGGGRRPAASQLSKAKSSSERKREMYVRMFKSMGIGDHTVVINTLVHKVRNNLTHWADDQEVIRHTLDVFYWLSAGYGSGKFMLSLEATQMLLAQHGPSTLRFLNVVANTRQRTRFYKTLARLVFIGDYENILRPFLRPIIATITQLGPSIAKKERSDAAKYALIGVCRDLRGIFSAALGSHSYGLLFDAIYPQHIAVLSAAPTVWADTPEVMNPVLKFFCELVNAKGSRIKFAPSSPNGILLFRQISNVVVAYGRALLTGSKPDSTREYSHWYKGMSLVLTLMSHALQGNYVNFGVFSLYNDQALSSSLQVSLQVLLSMKLAEIMAYPKVTKAYYQFLNCIFRYHLGTIVMVDSNTFLKLIDAFREGLEVATDTSIINTCAQSVDHLATFQFNNSNRPQKAQSVALRKHISHAPSCYTTFFIMLLNNVMYRNLNTCWSISRPLLSIMLANPQTLDEAKRAVLQTQPQANHQLFVEAFETMMVDISRNLETTNRDRFSQRVNMFRAEVMKFMVRPSSFDAL